MPLETAAHQLRTQATISAKGIATWNSNGRVPFDDMLEAAIAQGVEGIDLAACRAERDRQNHAFLAEYRQAQASRTPEEIAEQRAEARAAHGPGVELVNVFTGERYRT